MVRFLSDLSMEMSLSVSILYCCAVVANVKQGQKATVEATLKDMFDSKGEINALYADD